MSVFEKIKNLELSDGQKTMAKFSIPAFIGVLSGAVTVLSYLGSIIFTQNDAKLLLEKISQTRSMQNSLSYTMEKNRQELIMKIENIEDKLTNDGGVGNKEILGRVKELDNNINRRIDNLYEKLIERKR